MRELTPVNTALNAPLLIMGVEKRLMLMNILITFLLLAAGHFHLTVCAVAGSLFVALHRIGMRLTQLDPNIALIFKRTTRYLKQSHYPAIGSPQAQFSWDVQSITRPRV